MTTIAADPFAGIPNADDADLGEYSPALREVRSLTDRELAEAWCEPDADTAALGAEEERRKCREHQRRARRRNGQAAWYDAAYQQHLAAEAECRGVLVNPRGRARGVEPWSLWQGPWWQAERYASFELLRYWEQHPRLTMTEHARQERRDREAERDDYLDRDAGDPVRRGAGEGTPGAGDRGDSRRDAVPGHDARSQAAQAGPGPRADAGRAAAIRPGSAVSPQVAAVRAMAGAIRAGQPWEPHLRAPEPVVADPEPEPIWEPEAEPRHARVAVREPGAMVGSREPIDGAQVLGYVRAMLAEYASFPSPGSLDAVTLWAAHAHARDGGGRLAWRATPRLFLTSSEPGSGKSRVLELLGRLCPATFGLDTEPTAAALAHTLDKEHATALIDEADVLFGRGARKEGVRAVLNSGYTPNGTVLRMRGQKADRARVFGPVALAGLDVLVTSTGASLAALLDRCITIRMSKANGDLPDLDDRCNRGGELLRRALAAWAQENLAEMTGAEPEMPEGVRGRPAQIWQPLLAVADQAGQDWPERARMACEELAVRGGVSDDSHLDEMSELAGMFGREGGW